MAKFSHYEQCPRCLEKGRDNRGDNLAVYSDDSRHCFSCGYHKFPKHYTPKEKEVVHGTKSLPANVSREIPTRAWEWVLRYGLPMSYWKPFLYWHEESSRLIFTVGAGPEFSLGRHIPMALPAEGEGVGHVKPRKWNTWGDCHKTTHFFGDYRTSKEVVLVEDVISAHKVGQITSCISLFGTKVFDAVIPALRHAKLPVVLWLDKDQEGTLQRKCQWISTMTNLQCRYVVTDNDPKELSFTKIKEILQ